MKYSYNKNELEVMNRISSKICTAAGRTSVTFQDYMKDNAKKSKGLTTIIETDDEFKVEVENGFAVDILMFVEKCVDKLIPPLAMFVMAGHMFVDKLEELEKNFYIDVMDKYNTPAPSSKTDTDTLQ
jgi:hypothetical protein